MSILEVDRKRRIMLPKKIRDSVAMGQNVLMTNAGDPLKLIQLPSEPLRVLHGAFNTKKTFKELRRQAEPAAQQRTGKKPDYECL